MWFSCLVPNGNAVTKLGRWHWRYDGPAGWNDWKSRNTAELLFGSHNTIVVVLVCPD